MSIRQLTVCIYSELELSFQHQLMLRTRHVTLQYYCHWHLHCTDKINSITHYTYNINKKKQVIQKYNIYPTNGNVTFTGVIIICMPKQPFCSDVADY